MGEKVPKKAVEVRILEGGKEGVVISASAGDEIIWTTEEDGPGCDIVFSQNSPFKDSNGNEKRQFKVLKNEPARSGKGEYKGMNGSNVYAYDIHGPRESLHEGPTPTADRKTPGSTLLNDPIVIVDP